MILTLSDWFGWILIFFYDFFNEIKRCNIRSVSFQKTYLLLYWLNALLFLQCIFNAIVLSLKYIYTVMRVSFFSRQMALHVFVLIWRKGYLTPLYLCLFFFLFTNLFLQIHSIFPPFLKEKNRNKEKYKGFGRHHSIPSVKLKSKHI